MGRKSNQNSIYQNNKPRLKIAINYLNTQINSLYTYELVIDSEILFNHTFTPTVFPINVECIGTKPN